MTNQGKINRLNVQARTLQNIHVQALKNLVQAPVILCARMSPVNGTMLPANAAFSTEARSLCLCGQTRYFVLVYTSLSNGDRSSTVRGGGNGLSNIMVQLLVCGE